MKQSNYTVQIIEPSDGFYLTQKDEVELKDRFFSKKMFLAINDSVENYVEISESEAEEIMRQQEELAKKEAEQMENEVPVVE